MNSEFKSKIDKIMSEMTLQEKIGQLNQEIFDINRLDELKSKIRQGKVGSLILANSATAGNDKQEKTVVSILNELETIAVEESRSGIPLIYGRDVIHGHETVLPIPLALAATFNPEIVYNGYKCVAKEAKRDGVQWTFAPMVDISRDPRWGRCIEGSGEDPYLTEKIASAVIKGFQDEKVAACAKHYIGYGACEGGRDYGNAEMTDYTLRNTYLRPFMAAVKNDVATIMNSFNTIGGDTTSSSSYLINEILKEELGFEGFVISDWATVEQLIIQRTACNRKEAAEIAVNAGIDMDMVDKCYIEYLEELIREGKVDVETIDKAVSRVLYIKLKYGLFDNPYASDEKLDFSEHDKCAEICSDESIVLLKNNNILPLNKNNKLVITGPMAFEKCSLLGSWTLDGDVNRVNSIAEEIKTRSENAILPQSTYLWDDCFADIHKSDVVIVVLGESRRVTGEANSLSDINLSKEQLEYIKKLHRFGKPVVGVLCFGRPIGLEEAEPYLDAIIYSWHNGTRASQSVAKVLFGDVNPSGKLPMTIPRCTGQVPIYYNNIATKNEMTYFNANKKTYCDIFGTPMYPFGFGLSYTKFEYFDVSVEKDTLSVEQIREGAKFKIKVRVKNTGQIGGKEVSQCYIRSSVSSMIRPQRELKGFVKEYYEAGEEKEIYFELGFKELAFYNRNSEFTVEKGEIDIYVGTDCYANRKCVINVK